MTWQLAAFAILGIGLLAGFAWYERTNPDARIVALVGTLAAFAALGRIAFAAVPNVKPTSDIVLISGYALGGAPGYVVGAVAGLTSNFFFGQGPWTPWQMAGWGATGVAGALLARLTHGRIGRLPLALVSFVLGFAFTALQDVGDWVTYSDHSLRQLGFFVGKGIGFDLVYAVSCFGFVMLFGPALIRTLTRFRTRIQVTWLAPAARAAPAVLAVCVPVSMLLHTRAASAAALRGNPVAYIFGAENRDGGVGMAPGQPSDVVASGWQAIALADSPMDPFAHAKSGGRGVVSYLSATVKQERSAGDIERTVLAIGLVTQRFHTAIKLTDFGGRNLLTALRHEIGANGSVQGQTNLTAFAVLALRAARASAPVRSVDWLARQQDRDGGFNYATRGGPSDVDDTGAAIDALAGTDHPEAIARAVAFIRGQQNRDGGFGDEHGAASNAQSTAFAVCGLIGAKVDPATFHRQGAPPPLAYLRSLIQADGAIDYARANSQTPVWVTAEAEIALSGHTL